MDEIKVILDLSGAENITDLHIHVGPEQELLNKVEEVMADLADVLAKVTEVSASVQAVNDVVVETLKDVQRLISQGDTQPAVDALSGVVDSLNEVKTKLQDMDAAVEGASPEPTEPPTEPAPAPTDENFPL